jgi:hypothetical protein
MPLRLPIQFGNRNELIVELGVDLRSELLGHRGSHVPTSLSDFYFTSLPRLIKINHYFPMLL